MAVRNTILMHKYERDLIELMNDVIAVQNEDENYDFLEDEETIDSLFHVKDCYFSSFRSTSNAATAR